MSIKIGINGFGRIGRNIFRIASELEDVEIVSINDLLPVETAQHLLKYDSVMGRYDGTVELDGTTLIVDGARIPVTAERDPADLAWGDKGVDLVVESTGVFRDRAGITKHLTAGAAKVLLTVPSKLPSDVDATIVVGVNDGTLTGNDNIVSNASCTTNCLAPIAKVLHETYGIEGGLMIMKTIHTQPIRAP